MNEKKEIELLPGEKILFYSLLKDRLKNYRFDIIAHFMIFTGFLMYLILLIILLNFMGVIPFFKFDYISLITFLFVSLAWTFVSIYYFRALKVYKQNYPLVLTNKRIIKEMDFLKKKKPIGTFIEGAEKVAYIEATRREAYVYFKKDGEIKKVPLSYLSKYREDFKKALKELFGDRYVEKILWKERVPLNRKLIEEIFSDDKGKS